MIEELFLPNLEETNEICGFNIIEPLPTQHEIYSMSVEK
jgi:hypothetical protein